MTPQDIENIRKLTADHRTPPRPEAWDRVSEHLGHEQTKRKLSFYQKLSIAAAFIAVLSVGSLFSHYLEHRNPAVFATNEDYRPMILEDLAESTSTSLYTTYDVNKLHKLHVESSLRARLSNY